MREYALIVLNVSDAVHSIRSLYKLLSSYQYRHIQGTVNHLRWSVLQKEQCLGASANFFRVGEGVGLQKQGTSINILSKTQEKEALQGNILEFFLQNSLKNTYGKENLTQRWTQSGPFFFKIRTLFLIFKRGRGNRPFPLVARL